MMKEMAHRLGLGGVLLLAGLLGWRVVVTGLAEYYAERESDDAPAGALRWRDDQPLALYRQAQIEAARDPAVAERLFQSAAWANPTDARVYMALAELWAKAGRTSAAIEMAERADELGPLRSPVLMGSAEFWRSQGRLDRMLARWSMLLRTRPETSTQLYPVLLRLAEDSAGQALLKPLLDDPPEWWNGFFVYAARNAQQSETVVFLYQARQRHGELPVEDEQRAYLDRLWRDGRWGEAYLAWLGGLDEQQIKALGAIYNGGFEAPLTGVGFDWRAPPVHGATVELAPTYGVRGDQALHVSFNGQRVRFKHVSQYLFLDPGRYRLQGRVRPDGLQTERGLRWTVRCAPEDPLLAESERFLGSDEWRAFVVEFVVPASGCLMQVLRLELDGRVELDFEVDGGVWFDDLSAVRLE